MDQVGGLGGHFGGSWGPSWGQVGGLGGYLWDLGTYVGRSWPWKPQKWTSYRYLRGFYGRRAAFVLAYAGICWHMLACAGGVGGVVSTPLLKQELGRILAFP